MAAPANGKMVQLRIRPRLLGSTMSPGKEDLNSAMIAVYSESVMVLAVTDCLLTERVVEDIPVWFMSFQIGPLEPSMRP